MSSIYYDIFDTLLMIFEGWCVVKLFRAFVEPKSRSPLAKYAVGIFWSVCNIICYFSIDNGMGSAMLILKLFIYTFSIVLFSALWYKGSILQRIFPAVLFAAIRELVVQITNCLTILNTFSSDIMWQLYDHDLIAAEDCTNAVITVSTTILTLIMVFREFIIYRIVKRVAAGYKHKLQFNKEAALYLLPSVVSLAVSTMIRLILISVEDGFTHVIYERYPLLYVIIPATAAGLIASILYSFRLYQDMTAMRLEQADRAVLENQLDNMQNTLAEKERLYENLNAVRHDMKNSLSALRGLILRKCPDDEEINRYFDGMSASFKETESRVQTGSAVCDTIIGGKLLAAEKEIEGIRLDADDFIFPEQTGVDPYDLCVILSNGLDNAIEACRRLREKSPDAQAFITVRSFKQKNMFFAEIENSFDGVLKTDRDSGLPLSSKEGSLHGIGLRNIKKCAEKYLGSMDIIVGDGRFTLSVMLKERAGK